MRSDGALAYLADTVIDDELDLLADSDETICPACGSLLVEEDDADLLLHCPVCDREFR